MNVTSIIVTYSSRLQLCKRVIESALAAGVDDIVIVDNASDKEGSDFYKELSRSNAFIHLLSHSENRGSAGGYGAGLKYVLTTCNTDFVWLLDDDNVPEKGALKVLKSTWAAFHALDGNRDVALYSFRGDAWQEDRDVVSFGCNKEYLGNSFLGFNFFTGLLALVRPRRGGFCLNYPVARVRLGPYGGMFISLNNLRKIGFPDERFFVYADDHEYTLRLEDRNIDQFLVFFSQLKDVDRSPSRHEYYFSKSTPDLKLYYSLRNHTYIGRRYINNQLTYFVNKATVMVVIYCKFIKSLFDARKHAMFRMRLIRRAISDGEAGRLGRTF